jgi:hypothetical protein
MNIIIILLLVCLIYILYYIIFNQDKKLDTSINYNLKDHGFAIYKNILSNDNIEDIKLQIKNDKYKDTKQYIMQLNKFDDIIKSIGNGYIFQDYIWIIKKSSVHTCHRDNNGDFFNQGQKYPSYTMLTYLEDMDDCLGVIPGSHIVKNSFGINLTDKIRNLKCNKGDIIIFNANLIHVGILNPDKEDNLRIQMKISHKEDIDVLKYYENYNKVLNKSNNVPHLFKHIQKNFSCMFPILSDLTQKDNINGARGSDNGAEISLGQKIFSYIFYGDSKYYDLPNAF